MQQLDVPDLCAHLDRLQSLCNRLEGSQNEPMKYEGLVAAIRAEVDALNATICSVSEAKNTDDAPALE